MIASRADTIIQLARCPALVRQINVVGDCLFSLMVTCMLP